MPWYHSVDSRAVAACHLVVDQSGDVILMRDQGMSYNKVLQLLSLDQDQCLDRSSSV